MKKVVLTKVLRSSCEEDLSHFSVACFLHQSEEIFGVELADEVLDEIGREDGDEGRFARGVSSFLKDLRDGKR